MRLRLLVDDFSALQIPCYASESSFNLLPKYFSLQVGLINAEKLAGVGRY